MQEPIEEQKNAMLENLLKIMKSDADFLVSVVEVPTAKNNYQIDGGFVCAATNVSGKSVAGAYGYMLARLMLTVDSTVELLERQEPGRGLLFKQQVCEACDIVMGDPNSTEDQTIHIRTKRDN